VTVRRVLAVVGFVLAAAVLLPGPSASSQPTHGAARAADSDRVETLTTPKAVVLGLVEGVTEYLPVSSTGHLLVTEKILDVGQTDADRDATDTYTVVIQIGAILAVLGIFRKRFLLMLEGVVGRSAEGRSLVVSLLLAFVPAVVIALVFQDPIKERLLKPWPVVVAWVVGGVVILVFGANQSKLRARISSLGAIPPQVALGIGLARPSRCGRAPAARSSRSSPPCCSVARSRSRWSSRSCWAS